MSSGDAPRGTLGRAARVLRVPNLRATNREAWTQLVRFCVVGASGYLVNLAVFAAILNGAGLHHIAAAVGAFCVAWLNNFVLNRYWTFRDDDSPVAVQGARYLATSLVALGLNLAILQALVSSGMGELPAQAISILVVTPAAFLMNRRWAFR